MSEPSPEAVIEVATDQSMPKQHLACTHCDRTFSRPSHLQRHALTHLPPSRRNTLPCSQCDQSFSRKDTLLRHLRSTHKLDIPSGYSFQRSCYRCVRRKLKCDREQPCQSCILTGNTESCKYPTNDQGINFSGQSLISDSTVRSFGQSRSPTNPSSKSASSIANDDTAPVHDGDFPGHDNTPDQLIFGDEQINTTFLAQNSDLAMHQESPHALFAGDIESGFRCNGFDWLDFDILDVDITNIESFDVAQSAPITGPELPVPSFDNHLPSPPTHQTKTASLPWPFEQGRTVASPNQSIPSLGRILQGCLGSSLRMPSPPLQGVAVLFAEPLLPSPHEIRDPIISQGMDLLKTLIDIYFTSFQVIQPIIHVPTWNMANCPTVQLASMACVGAVLSTDTTLSSSAGTLSDLCTRMLSWLGLSDTAQYSDVAYLTSLCLHQIYSLGSGDRALYQNADRTRGVLIGSLRGLGLLRSRPSLQDQQTSHEPTQSEASDVHLRWSCWIEREKQNRLAWASFEYDCSLCTLTSRRGAVDLDELPQTLPCFDALWEAPSAYAWAALRSRFPQQAFGARLSTVLSDAVSGKSPPEYTSSWGRRLCTQIIGRLLWDLKQLETLSTSSFFGLQSLSTSHQQSKTSLLRGLDNLLQTICRPISTMDLVSFNISSFLCHYSHLYTADNIMDLVLYIVRSVVSRGSEDDNKVNAARRQLVIAFSNETRRARELAWHAGQMLSVANDFIVSAPCEIMRLFMSYIFIIAFIKYCPAQHHAQFACRDGPVQLDLLVEGSERGEDVSDWIKYGGPASIGTAKDIFSSHASKSIAQDAQKIFQRLISWGLADKFVRIIAYYESNDIPC